MVEHERHDRGQALARGAVARVTSSPYAVVAFSSMAFDRITFDPQIMGGRACIRGMRIPVSVIVGQIAHGASFDEILVG